MSTPDPFVGLALNPGPREHVLPSADEMRALGANWVRYLLTHPFQDFQTGRNSELDWLIERYRDLDARFLILINPETLDELPPLNDPGAWDAYSQRVADLAQKIATYYRGKIHAFEVFNEPETQNILPENFAAILNAAYPKIKWASAVTVIAGGICCGLHYPYLQRVMDLARDSCDAVGWHPYGMRVDGFPFADWGFGDLRTSITQARAIAGKPLWITEIGAEIAYQWGAGIEPTHAVADYLTRAFSLMRELGADTVARAFWFTWRISETGWGLVDDAGTRRPAWFALQQQAYLPPISITSVKFDPTTLGATQQLGVSITIKNNSHAPIATQDPQPGFVYAEGDTFYSRGFAEVAGAYRVGVDFDYRAGIDHPYRWGLGAPLAPGETRTISGAIQLQTPIARTYWAGVVQEQVAWHQDRQGAQTITVLPNVEMRDVKITPVVLSAGQFLQIRATVINNGTAPLATQGPEPGFIYDEGETFISRGYASTTGKFRIGIDFDTRAGMDHPYRWGLGSPLAPGQARTITGLMRVDQPQTQNYWAGLVHEFIAWIQDRQGTQAIQVIAAGKKPEIVSVVFSPSTLSPGDLLNVNITIRNTTDAIWPTQDPPPGFVYDEGDTFYARGFPDVPGAVRVAVDFDNRSGIDHPYRWGLGAPIAPGETRTITGAIHLARAQTQNYWAGLVEERVAWLRDREGIQAIRVTPDAHPRVIHVHDLNATNWGRQANYWNYVNQSVVNDMVTRGMIALTGRASLADAWRAILPRYQPGQAIAIKINFANGGDGKLDPVPHTLNAIVRGLTAIGVRENDVWVVDATQNIPARYVQGCEFRGVQFFDEGAHLRAGFTSSDPNAIIPFTPPSNVPPLPQIKITDVLVNATYIINLPLFKGHKSGAGVTFGFKHHLGSTNDPAAFHPYIFVAGANFGSNYNPLVDLNRMSAIRDKTMVTIADGLFTADDWDSLAMPMQTFGNQTPNSLFFATDPVALDCVLFDLFAAEWQPLAGSDNYLRLAANAGLGVYERGDPWGSGYKQIEYRKI